MASYGKNYFSLIGLNRDHGKLFIGGSIIQPQLTKHCDIPEWAIIELQGDLDSRTGETMTGKFVGDLHFTKKGIPILIIGHHILYGKVVEMEKPLIAIQKTNDYMEIEAEGKEEKAVQYSISCFMKRKLLFKSRPKPIIMNTPGIS